MIERVHEHLIGELRQNTRTDTIFVLTALILNLVVLAANSAIAGQTEDAWNLKPILTQGRHTLTLEVRDRNGDWQDSGELGFRFETDGSGESFKLPQGPRDLRIRIDDVADGWLVASDVERHAMTQTTLMYVFIALQIVVNAAVVAGLLKGKAMRLEILDGLLRMYRDQEVNTYYGDGLLRAYGVRYRLFIAVVIFFGLVSIIVPLIIRYS